jgi:hypothetical protein
MSLPNWVQIRQAIGNYLRNTVTEILDALEETEAKDELLKGLKKGGVHGQKSIIKELERRANKQS